MSDAVSKHTAEESGATKYRDFLPSENRHESFAALQTIYANLVAAQTAFEKDAVTSGLWGLEANELRADVEFLSSRAIRDIEQLLIRAGRTGKGTAL